MNNVQFLENNCPDALKGFEELTLACVKIKYHLSHCVKDGNEKLIDDAIIWHVNQSLHEHYHKSVKNMIDKNLIGRVY